MLDPPDKKPSPPPLDDGEVRGGGTGIGGGGHWEMGGQKAVKLIVPAKKIPYAVGWVIFYIYFSKVIFFLPSSKYGSTKL